MISTLDSTVGKTVLGENVLLIVLPIKNIHKVCDKAGNVTFHQYIVASYHMGLIDVTGVILSYHFELQKRRNFINFLILYREVERGRVGQTFKFVFFLKK